MNALTERVHEALRQAEAHTRRARLLLEGDKQPVVEPEDETVGERLKRLRDERGLSQREISSPGVSYAYISRIEAGARTPSVKAIRLLAEKLGVTPEYLETGDDLLTVKLPREVVLLAIWAQRTGDDIPPYLAAIAEACQRVVTKEETDAFMGIVTEPVTEPATLARVARMEESDVEGG